MSGSGLFSLTAVYNSWSSTRRIIWRYVKELFDTEKHFQKPTFPEANISRSQHFQKPTFAEANISRSKHLEKPTFAESSRCFQKNPLVDHGVSGGGKSSTVSEPERLGNGRCVYMRRRSHRQWTTQKRLCPRWLLVNPLQLGAKHRFQNPFGVDLSHTRHRSEAFPGKGGDRRRGHCGKCFNSLETHVAQDVAQDEMGIPPLLWEKLVGWGRGVWIWETFVSNSGQPRRGSVRRPMDNPDSFRKSQKTLSRWLLVSSLGWWGWSIDTQVFKLCLENQPFSQSRSSEIPVEQVRDTYWEHIVIKMV